MTVMWDHPIWSPNTPTIAAGVSPASATFRIPSRVLGGTARVFNDTATPESFTIGPSGTTNTMMIPLAPRESMFIAFAPGDTNISASAATVFITPGIVRP